MHFVLASLSHVPQVTELIRTENRTSLLSRLGRRFLSKYFLPDLINDPDARLFIAEANGEVVGYVAFVIPDEVLTTTLWKHKWSMLASILQNPHRAPRILCDIFLHAFLAFYHIEVERETLHGVARLVLMGVRRDFQSKGVGQALLQHCFGTDPNLQSTPILVDTDTQRAATFYERNGFKRIGWEPRWMYKNLILLRGLAVPQ